MKKNRSKKVILMGIIIILIILLIIFLAVKNKKNKEETTNNTTDNSTNMEIEKERDDEDKRIDINENIEIDREIKNLKDVRCRSISIDQREEEMRVSIYIRNMSKTEKVEAKTLKINLLNKSNKVIYSQDVEMEEIEAYGFTNIDLELTIQEPVLVYDVDIIANE